MLRLHCCCDKSLALILSLRYVARIQTSLNSCDRSQQQNSVAATMIFTCHTRRFVAATCRGDVSKRFVASYVSAFKIYHSCLDFNRLLSFLQLTLMLSFPRCFKNTSFVFHKINFWYVNLYYQNKRCISK